jgi:alcohol-forming fatty acyl-CoA reductase
VIDSELFGLPREKHGADGFQQFIQDKVVALSGDIIHENLGLEAPMLKDLAEEIDVIVNIAATTNFYGRYMLHELLVNNNIYLHGKHFLITDMNSRYDVSLDVNVMGVKHLCHFAKQCPRLKMLMQVSTGQ